MDNIAHSLIGAALGRAVGGERVPAAALVGALAANAPDWAELFTGWPWPGAVYLAEHRGVTHAILGVTVEITALIVGVGSAWWWQRRWRPASCPPVAWGWLAALVTAAVVSHPLMDWQGSYGLRPFLPWSDRWYYGDFVAIVDPIYWIVPLVAVAWGAERHWRPLLGFGLIGTATTALVLGNGLPAGWIKALWLALCVLAAAGWIGHWFGVARRRAAAAWALAVVALYAAAQGAASLPVKATARREAVARFGPGAQWAALTVVGRPFTWQPIYAHPDTIAGPHWSVARHLDRPEVQRALRATRDGRAIARFARFLAAVVDTSNGARRVILRDARFGNAEWATVEIDAKTLSR